MPRSSPTRGPSPSPDLQRALAEAAALHQRGMLAEAEQQYRAALAIDPDHSGVLHALGLLRAGQGDLDQAIRLLRKAADRAPRWAAAHNDLGAALQAAGRHKQAVASHRRAIAIQPDDASAHFNLAAALHALGRLDAALAPYQAALARRPSFVQAAHNLGDALAALSRPEAAATWFARALEIGPEVAETHNKLGMVLAGLGRRDEAIDSFRRAITLRPDQVDAHNNLGGLLFELGRLDDAADAFEAATTGNPERADLHSNRGVVLAALKRHEEAATCFERAIALQPDLAEAHNNLGNALQTLNRGEAALACFEKAIALRPDDAEALNKHGALLGSLGRPQEALAWFDRALAIQPNYVAAHENLGIALFRLSRESEAIERFERALAIDPGHAASYRNLGEALRTLGRLDDARRAIETAVALEPDGIEHYFALASVKQFTAGDSHLAAMERLSRDLDAYPEAKRIDFHFHLGKAYADVGEHARAFEHLLAGNALKRRSVVYDEAGTLGWFERIPQLFTPAVMERQRGNGASSRVPVFIVGMPRSGTTLVEQILASHPAIFGAGEIDDFRIAMAQLVGPDGAPLVFPELAAVVTGEQLHALGAAYLSRLTPIAPTAARITDKLPLNFACAGLIHLALPGARIIHVRRDPIDTCLSCFATQFAGYQPYSYELSELGRYYRAYETVMAQWRRVLPPGVMLEVRYEDVIEDLEREARRLVAHCGLTWDDSCLAFHRTQRPVRTASVSQVRQPIYRSSVARWKPYELLLTPLLEALGGRAAAP